MTVEVEIDNACAYASIPDSTLISKWATAAARSFRKHAEICVRIVDEEESKALNFQYRGQNKSTNVLSFPSNLPEDFDPPLLGDVVICASVVEREALEQNKTLEAHWAHMLVHSILHLLGFDHAENSEAEIMESHEVAVLQNLGFAHPYE